MSPYPSESLPESRSGDWLAVLFRGARPASRRARARKLNRLFCVTVSLIFTLCIYQFKDSAKSLFNGTQRQYHLYGADGILEVNASGGHPIPELIEHARRIWEDKLSRQSKTLDEAVDEYVKRYGRLPPKGFDVWWQYALENNVQLPDEYDSINEKLSMFWGVDPVDLQKIQADWEGLGIAIGKENGGPLQILRDGMHKSDKDKANIERPLRNRILPLRKIEHLLPDFHASASADDNPNLVISWEFKDKLLTAAAMGKYYNVTDLYPDSHGWIGTCHPDSPARQINPNIRVTVPSDFRGSPNKTFIHDHRQVMDPCLHPWELLLEGQFLVHADGPGHSRRPVPQFSFSPTALHYDLNLIPMGGFGYEHEDLPWAEKTDERLLWRGTNTGMRHEKGRRWEQSQRPRLVQLGRNTTGTVEILSPEDPRYAGRFGGRLYGPGKNEGNLVIQIWPKSQVVSQMLDIAYVGTPGSCDVTSCEKLVKDYGFQEFMDFHAADKYKYVLDVDGHAWSNRFRRLMLTNSLIFKSTMYPEWFTERIQAWAHYIPVSLDYADLLDSLAFFRGDPYGSGRHDELANEIAQAGRKWAEEFWREEDAIAYMFRMILEYVRIMSTDRDAMSYIYRGQDISINVQDA